MNFEKVLKMCWIRPKSHDVMNVIGNQDVFMIEKKEMMGNTMIKLKGFKGWFNLNDFEVVK